MKVYRKAFIAILCAAFLGIGTGSVLLAADMTNITGTVNEDGQLVEDSGQVYDIAEDEVGMQAMEHSGEKIAIEGTVQEEDGSRVIVIKSFKLLD